jgi:bifunctional non-homologous end joining protein LigD
VQFFEEVKARGDEGIIIKQIDSPYEHERSFNWQKIKNWKNEICDVVGYTIGEGNRKWAFGSLVLSQNGKYVGKVGSGFSDLTLRQLKDMLSDAPKVSPPFDIGEPYTAVDANIQTEVKFYKYSCDNIMRFPVFVRIVSPSDTRHSNSQTVKLTYKR